jgi:hypothetical protein
MRRALPREEKVALLPRFEGFRDSIAHALMAADQVVWRSWNCSRDTHMLAPREELPMEDNVAQLEPRVARIEADVSQLNARVANVEVDLRDFRKSMDHKFEVMDARFDHRLDVLTATVAEGFRAMDGKLAEGLKAIDGKLDRLDAKFDGKLDSLDAKFEGKLDSLDAKFEGKLDSLDAKFESRFDTLGKRRFALLVALLSATVTLVTAVLGLLLRDPHGH